MSGFFSATRLRCLAVATVLVMVAGCGTRRADVTGKVSHKGRPIVYGTVSVIGPDQMTYYGQIKPDGTFTVPGVPVGLVKLAVYSPDPYFEPPVSKEMKAKIEEARREANIEIPPKPPKGQWIRLPARYADPLSSGLTGEVAGQPTVIDLELK